MKIIALSVPGPNTRPKEDGGARGRGSQKRLGAFEGRRCARGLPKERQTGVVVVLEASTVEAAETALSQLPYRHGFIRFDLIPVGPFTNFERLFS